jgi:hypothetical protein
VLKPTDSPAQLSQLKTRCCRLAHLLSTAVAVIPQAAECRTEADYEAVVVKLDRDLDEDNTAGMPEDLEALLHELLLVLGPRHWTSNRLRYILVEMYGTTTQVGTLLCC